MSLNSYIRKQLGKLVEPRRNKGDCPFCSLPVYVAEGQLYKTLKGKPVHKKCRKS